MSSNKYPPFERVTAGRLSVGDEILIRDRQSDYVWLERPHWNSDTRDYEGGTRLTTGVHQVTAITYEIRPGYRRGSRLYNVTVSVAGIGEQTATVSAICRWNKVTL